MHNLSLPTPPLIFAYVHTLSATSPGAEGPDHWPWQVKAAVVTYTGDRQVSTCRLHAGGLSRPQVLEQKTLITEGPHLSTC